jgi:alkylation response protein AidB-like acyl-CoA dehydrogenase
MTMRSGFDSTLPLWQGTTEPFYDQQVSSGRECLPRATVPTEHRARAVATASLGRLETAEDIIAAVTRLADYGALALPLPGSGDTADRFRALAELAAIDLCLARLAEGHVDAVAILAEADLPPRLGIYGVWAADPPDARLVAEPTASGWSLHGRKRYATGARGLHRALVTAHTDDGVRLFDVDLRSPGVLPVPDTWRAVGMAATDSLDVVFESVALPATAAVGPPGFYLDRPGFWHGAVGVAACWFGGALGAYRMLRDLLRRVEPTAHQAAHLGAIAASCFTMAHVLDAAARDIDNSPREPAARGHQRALWVRHAVEQGCQEVLLRTGRAGGTAPLAFDHSHARRAADLATYLRQHDAERDLAALGHLAMGTDPCREP